MSKPSRKERPDLGTFAARSDRDVPGHSERVAAYAVKVASELGLERGDIENIRHAAVLHDIGKVVLSDEIVGKLGKLTDKEFEVMKLHATVGLSLIEQSDGLRGAAPLIRHHHERMDGTGYPDGLTGDAIPLGARIIGVCEAFDIMTSDVPWRERVTPEEAVQELRRCAGAQFDPVVVDAFERVLTAMQEYRAAA